MAEPENSISAGRFAFQYPSFVLSKQPASASSSPTKCSPLPYAGEITKRPLDLGLVGLAPCPAYLSFRQRPQGR